MSCRSGADETGGKSSRHRWVVAIGAIGLIAAHGFVLQYVLSRAAISLTAAVGVLGFILVKHLGLSGAVFAAVRRLWQLRR